MRLLPWRRFLIDRTVLYGTIKAAATQSKLSPAHRSVNPLRWRRPRRGDQAATKQGPGSRACSSTAQILFDASVRQPAGPPNLRTGNQKKGRTDIRFWRQRGEVAFGFKPPSGAAGIRSTLRLRCPTSRPASSAAVGTRRSARSAAGRSNDRGVPGTGRRAGSLRPF